MTEAPARHESTGSLRRTYLAVREIAIVAVLAIALSLVVKTWLAQAFYIPSGSMEDTLSVGDRVIVNKLVPGAVPLQRGDIVVFEDPGNWLPPTTPADHGPLLNALERGLRVRGADAELGGGPPHQACHRASGRSREVLHHRRKLQVNGVAIEEPYVKPGDVPSSMSFDITVPAGRIWVMGDHRKLRGLPLHDPDGNGRGGSVPVADVTGRAFVIVWPFGHAEWLGRAVDTFSGVPQPTTAP